jgi:crotonobetainyl-CoA:carnitine CoA-transferase CaiB-like acyl-CoA transferase
MRPLDGIKVLDLSRILAGPLVGQMLGDLGAEVVKVERPGKGDDAREMGPPFLRDKDGNPTTDAGFFLACNRNKKSITIDIAKSEGQDLIKRLTVEADVFLENFKTGALARYGLDYATLSKLNPRLVYCSITGFGQTGPYAAKPGYDGVFQAMGGLMSVSGHAPGTPGAGPMKVGISMVDILTSYNASTAIAAALYHRDAKGGTGQNLDISLLDCGVAALSHFAQSYLISGIVPERRGNGGYGGIPSQSFQCADSEIFVVVGNNDQYQRFCDAIERPDMFSDPRFSTGPGRIGNRLAILSILEPIFLTRPAAVWLSLLDAAGVPVAPVNDMRGALADPQIVSRGMVQEVEHPVAGRLKLLANPLRFSETPLTLPSAPPVLGADSAEVLSSWLGLDEAAQTALRSRGIL